MAVPIGVFRLTVPVAVWSLPKSTREITPVSTRSSRANRIRTSAFRSQVQANAASAARGDCSSRGRRDAGRHRPVLQREPSDHYAAGAMTDRLGESQSQHLSNRNEGLPKDWAYSIRLEGLTPRVVRRMGTLGRLAPAFGNGQLGMRSVE